MTEAYITILVGDGYLPGSLTLARSLRDLGTTKKLAILTSGVSLPAIDLLKEVYDDVIDVQQILSTSLDQLAELGRTDLVSTYTKILVWKQEQYSKLVYLDSDVLPVVNLDDFFNISLDDGILLAAAPDAGWPDIFNSGVFVTEPSSRVFDGLMKTIQTEEIPSFDGGDQGLLNEFFMGRWERLPFTSNVTPGAGYQYVPAFLRFQKDIKNIHFIGLTKPWHSRDASILTQGSAGKGYDTLVSFHKAWWDVFNRHYFGKVAGTIYEISKAVSMQDVSLGGEGHLLSIPKLSNQWDLNESSEIDADDSRDIAYDYSPIFPWEGDRPDPERVFDESTDFHV